MQRAPKDPTDLTHNVAAQLDELIPADADASLAVAVSGGSDSMALTLLVSNWARQKHVPLTALTVDHGLRAGSEAEAAQVAKWLAKYGINHRVLTWAGVKPTSGIQSRARAARYGLLNDWCRQNNIWYLLTAHHRDDQIETVVMRLERGSGFAGLAGMARCKRQRGVCHLRPLLAFTRADLKSFLEHNNQPWINDPSNMDTAFTRIRMRHKLAEFGPEGPELKALLDMTDKAARIRGAWGKLFRLAANRVAYLHPAGFVQFRFSHWRMLPTDLASEVLRRALMCVGGSDYGPNMQVMKSLTNALNTQDTDLSRSLHNCHVRLHRDAIFLIRENRNLPENLQELHKGSQYWGNYRLDLSVESEQPRANSSNCMSFGPLGLGGWEEISSDINISACRGLPKAIFPVLPCIRSNETVVFAPYLGFMSRSFTEFYENPPIIVFEPRHRI